MTLNFNTAIIAMFHYGMSKNPPEVFVREPNDPRLHKIVGYTDRRTIKRGQKPATTTRTANENISKPKSNE